MTDKYPPLDQWIKCKGCGDLTPPDDIEEGAYCTSCEDGRIWMRNRGIDPDQENPNVD